MTNPIEVSGFRCCRATQIGQAGFLIAPCTRLVFRIFSSITENLISQSNSSVPLSKVLSNSTFRFATLTAEYVVSVREAVAAYHV